MMERRRGQKRPAPTEDEESNLWSRILKSISDLSTLQSSSRGRDIINNVNSLFGKLASEDGLVNGGAISKTTHLKLKGGLDIIKTNAEEEEKIINQVLEDLQVLRALREAPREASVHDNRRKRQRVSPSASNRSTPYATPPVQGAPSRLPGSLAQQNRAKARRDVVPPAQILLPGRLVAFRPPSKGQSSAKRKGSDTPEEGAAEAEDETWILASVKSRSESHPQLYVVEDIDKPEEGGDKPIYTAPIQSMIPLPDTTTAAGQPTHPTGSIVLALYPDTTSLYRATVVSGPTISRGPIGPEKERKQVYRVEFEDDGDAIREVPVDLLVPHPTQR